MAPAGSPLVTKQLMGLRLSAVWAMMVAFRAPVNMPDACRGLEGAFIDGSRVLSWAGNNSAKMGLPHGLLQCWTLISTNKFGQANKVPQEKVPQDVHDKVRARARRAEAADTEWSHVYGLLYLPLINNH